MTEAPSSPGPALGPPSPRQSGRREPGSGVAGSDLFLTVQPSGGWEGGREWGGGGEEGRKSTVCPLQRGTALGGEAISGALAFGRPAERSGVIDLAAGRALETERRVTVLRGRRGGRGGKARRGQIQGQC